MKYICCICGKDVDKRDVRALSINIESINRRADDEPVQNFVAHVMCFEGILSSIVPFDSDVFFE